MPVINQLQLILSYYYFHMKFIIASYENSFSKCMILRETPGKPRSNVSKRQYDPILHE